MGVSFGNKGGAKQVQEQAEQALQEANEQVVASQEQAQVAQAKLAKLTSQKCGTVKAGDVVQELTLQQTGAVTELALLKRSLDEVKSSEKAAEEYRKSLLEIANGAQFPADQPVVFTSEMGEVIFKPNAEERQITDLNGLIGAIKEKVGYDGLLKVLKINLTDVDKILTPLEAQKYINKVPGKRTLGSTKVIE